MANRATSRSRAEGAVVVAFAISLALMIATLGLALDVGYWYWSWSTLQAAADQAALAGAVDLPNATSGAGAAGQMASLNGASSSEVAVSRPYPPASPSPNQYEVVIKRNVSALFSAIVGIGNVTISVRAVAQKDVTTTEHLPPAFTNAIFSGRQYDPGTTMPDIIDVNGSKITVNGPVQINGSWNDAGSQNTFNGPVQVGHQVKTTGSGNIYGDGLFPGSPVQQMPSVDTSGELTAAQAAGTYYVFSGGSWSQWNPATGSLVSPAVPPAGAGFSGNTIQFSGSSVTVSGTLYVQGGNVSIQGSSVSGTGNIVTDGDISVSGSGVVWSSSSALGLISLSTDAKAIAISGSSSTYNAALLAPNGGITISGSGLNFSGGLFANNFDQKITGSSMTINWNKSIVSQLPVLQPINYVHMVQ